MAVNALPVNEISYISLRGDVEHQMAVNALPVSEISYISLRGDVEHHRSDVFIQLGDN